ncbi:MAG: endonuclease/exonuclease/phosphatase family protein [Rhodothermia bacterium]|nr:endonuclease/exonuclease/phosphatase family protein [Rhodothermia bacterium]
MEARIPAKGRRALPDRNHLVDLKIAVCGLLCITGCARQDAVIDGPVRLRVATYNIEDLRTTDLLRDGHPRLRAAAATIQILRPDILLINEMAYDQEGVPGYSSSEGSGHNAARFVNRYLSVPQDSGLAPLKFEAISFPSNTGLPSGHDLDNSGEIVSSYPPPEPSAEDGAPPRQTADQRAYGNDSWGFGTFPGQYAMALFVTPRLQVISGEIRSFQKFKWSDMPRARKPVDPKTGEPWYDSSEWADMRLSSKNHVDVPVRLPNGQVVHLLVSHPTPPAFDGPEARNKLRNHDEIRFWRDYVAGDSYMTDDSGVRGGLKSGALFVIMGDLNADPDEGSSVDNPIGKLTHLERVNGEYVPAASTDGIEAFPTLDADDTAEWGLRIDYVLPSVEMEVFSGGVWRPSGGDPPASDHFPVYLDLIVPDPGTSSTYSGTQ